MCDYPCHHVISEQLAAQCSQALSLFHAYTGCDLPSSMHCRKMDEMCCMFFMLQKPLSPWPKTQPALSQIPRIWHVWNIGLCWCRPKTVTKPLSVKPENAFPSMARSLWAEYHQHSMLPTCKRALMVAAFTKMLSFLVPLYEAGNGMTGPRHGYLAWLMYLTLAGLLFAVALWMYSCV